jgi:hypothetical protein
MEAPKRKQERPLGGRHFVGVEDPIRMQDSIRDDFRMVSRSCEARYPDVCREFRDFWNSVDFQNIYDIFYEYLDKFGVSRDRLNTGIVLFFSDILDPQTTMTYDMDANAIIVNVPYIHQSTMSGDLGPAHVTRLYGNLLHTLLHEFSHAFGHTEHIRMESIEDGKIQHISTYGFDRRGVAQRLNAHGEPTRDSLSESINVLFNEGVTELISHEVLEEYVHRKPIDGIASTVPFEHDSRIPTIRNLVEENISAEKRTYSIVERFVVAFTGAIADKTGVPQETVWRSLERQYFSGELSFQEFSNTLDELWGKGFAGNLGTADDGLSITNLTLRFKEISAKYPEAVDRWLQHLDLSRGAQ